MRGVRVPDLAAIFVVGTISGVMGAIFYAPLSSGHIQQEFPVCFDVGDRRNLCNGEHRFVTFLARLHGGEVAMDPSDLRRAREAHVFWVDGQGPQVPLLDSTMSFLNRGGLRRMSRGEKRCRADSGPSPVPRAGCLSVRRSSVPPSPG